LRILEQATATDRPRWDERLIAGMSRRSGQQGSSRAAHAWIGASHGLIVAVTAAITQAPFWIATAIAYAVIIAGRLAWPRARRARERRSAASLTPNPFGQ
jgi:hypothetical protein